ncbi:GNAT family N-acetyltransferase [Telmatocola sphagniphila]|jgi:ribosomal protein S18 acetylase RimI-like enzyme|uniref:GNAT family N-acetyltransferase n=1 Tax=Telmatocola sphagniphila TaxID=1123043 RepID=A0A8E6B156_9BACT|nr:GNAT family N-acetyltransferase [Telmatocola sphagniphila]QVL29818.1 GNAT family N-acetyltransferase [Telmatocola sphagniphila]
MRIRRASVTDIAVLVEFNRRLAWETEHKKLLPETLTSGVTAIFSDPAKGFYLVAEVNGVVVGQLMITYEWSDWRNGWFWWVQSVYVQAEHRRGGVFRSLFQEAEKLGHEQGNVVGLRLYVEKENERGQKTYQSLGMEEIPFLMYQKGWCATAPS